MVAHLIITGSVQGVGYRQFVKQNAVRLGLTGLVRNTSDGSVEAVFQGDKKIIESMIALCKNGPFLAEVKNISVQWKDTMQHFSSFEILPS